MARQNAEVKAQNERLELAGSKAVQAAEAFKIVESSAKQAGIDAAAKMVAEADAAAAAAKADAAAAKAAAAKAEADAAADKAAAETAAADAAAKAAFAAAEASHAKAAAERLPAEASSEASAEADVKASSDLMREAVKIVEAKIGDQLPKAKDSSLCKQGCCMDWTEEQKEMWNNALNEALVEVRAKAAKAAAAEKANAAAEKAKSDEKAKAAAEQAKAAAEQAIAAAAMQAMKDAEAAAEAADAESADSVSSSASISSASDSDASEGHAEGPSEGPEEGLEQMNKKDLLAAGACHTIFGTSAGLPSKASKTSAANNIKNKAIGFECSVCHIVNDVCSDLSKKLSKAAPGDRKNIVAAHQWSRLMAGAEPGAPAAAAPVKPAVKRKHDEASKETKAFKETKATMETSKASSKAFSTTGFAAHIEWLEAQLEQKNSQIASMQKMFETSDKVIVSLRSENKKLREQ